MFNQHRWENIRQTLLDVLFPPTNRSLRVRTLSPADLQSLPQASSPEPEFVHALLSYHNKRVRAIVQAAKYDGSRKAARLIGELLHDHLLSVCAEKRIITERIGLVPIPLSAKRRRTRGFNQARRIVNYMIVASGGTESLHLASVLEKTRETTPQTRLDKRQRRNNLQDCFQLKSEESVENKTLVLIDDVTTTGTTFREAKRTLAVGNPETVIAIAFAH